MNLVQNLIPKSNLQIRITEIQNNVAGPPTRHIIHSTKSIDSPLVTNLTPKAPKIPQKIHTEDMGYFSMNFFIAILYYQIA